MLNYIKEHFTVRQAGSYIKVTKRRVYKLIDNND